MNNHFIAKSDFSSRILSWYDDHARSLPWRSVPGQVPDPYHVWLSEIMLQQTTVVTVGPYFNKFLTQWPTIRHMAEAPLDDILTAWAGLGYYARARNLHKCAAVICQDYDDTFPDNLEDLKALPGIGDYTAAAISSIAFDTPSVVVDGNIERIISRFFRIEEELPKSRKTIREMAGKLSPTIRPGDYAQALMDIGATVCTPKNAKCAQCPVSVDCAGFKHGDFATYPKKAPKKAKPTKRAAVFWIEKPTGEVLMRRREEKGLLGGMMEFPSTQWDEGDKFAEELQILAAEIGLTVFLDTQNISEQIKHTFTHFHLHLSPTVIRLKEDEQILSNEIQWVHPDDFGKVALPTLMRKVSKVVLNQ